MHVCSEKRVAAVEYLVLSIAFYNSPNMGFLLVHGSKPCYCWRGSPPGPGHVATPSNSLFSIKQIFTFIFLIKVRSTSVISKSDRGMHPIPCYFRTLVPFTPVRPTSARNNCFKPFKLFQTMMIFFHTRFFNQVRPASLS